MPVKAPSRIIETFKKHYYMLSLLLLFLYALLSVKTIFLEGMIPGWDNPVHYVNSYLTALYMFPKLDILGWDPFNQFGWVFNLYYNPGMSIFVASVYYFFLGLIDPLMAYKIAFFLAYFLLAPAVFMFVHALTEDKIAPVVASLLSITTFTEESTWFDAGLKQMYYIGMWPERLGLVFLFFSIALLAYSFKSKELSKTLLFTGLGSLFFSMSVLSHVMMGISAALIAFLLWLFVSGRTLTDLCSVDRLKPVLKTEAVVLAKFASMGLLSLGMAAFWMVPLFQTIGAYHSFPAVTWATGPYIFGEIFASMPWYLLVFYCLGAFTPVYAGKRISYSSLAASAVILILQFLNLVNLYDGNIGLRLIFAFMASLVLLVSSRDLYVPFLLASISILGFLATGPDTYLVYFGPFRLDLLSLIPFARSFGYSKFNAPVRILILSLAALGFSKVLSRLYALSKTTRFPAVFSIVSGLLAFLILNSSLSAQLQNTDLAYPFSKEKVFKLTSDYPGFEKVDELIGWVENNVPKDTYILFQDTLDFGDSKDFQTSHYVYIASIRLKRPIIGGCFGTRYITNTYALTEGGYLLSFSVEKLIKNNLIQRLMDELGIGYIAIHDSRLINFLNSSADFRLEHYNGLYAVFRKTNSSKIVFIQGDGTVESVDFTINRIQVTVSNVSGNTSYLIVRQVNFPGFTAEADGEIIPVDTYYPKLPNVITGWHGIQPVFNWRIPFIKVKIPAGSNRVTLRFSMHTVGSDVSKIAWAVFLCLLISGIALPIARKLHGKWRK
ncbi:MAG: hypothetical protein ACPL4E_06115 [Thermoproteota archaeon]